jgi:hypothetical protein
LFALVASESAGTVAIEAVQEVCATSAVLARVRDALVNQLRAVLACVAKQASALVVVWQIDAQAALAAWQRGAKVHTFRAINARFAKWT